MPCNRRPTTSNELLFICNYSCCLLQRITKEVWAKAEDHVLKIEKDYGKENCIDRSEIPPIIIDFDDDESSDEES